MLLKYATVQKQCEQLEETLRTSIAIAKSQARALVPLESGKEIEKQLHELGGRYREKKNELEEIYAQLARLQFVPVSAGASQGELGSAAQDAKTRAKIEELKGEMRKLTAIVSSLQNQNQNQAPEQPQSDAPTVTLEKSQRAAKRLRAERTAVKIEELRTRLAESENQLNQIESERIDEIQAAVQERWDALKAAEPLVDPEVGYKREMDAWIEKFQGTLRALDGKVKELSGQLARAAEVQTALQDQNSQLRNENIGLQLERERLLNVIIEVCVVDMDYHVKFLTERFFCFISE